MKKSLFSPLMVAGLVLVMVLAVGCERPDQQAVLETPAPVGPQALATLPPAVAPTPTLPAGEMPSDLPATLAAQAAAPQPVATLPAPAGAAEATPLSAFPQPAEPTAAPLVVSTPVPPTAVPATLTPLSPIGGLHTVQPGERLFSIARLYNVNPYAIAQLNAIPAPYLIYPGQQLKIPGTGSVTPAPPPSGATSYTVLPGDSLFRIALRFGRSMQSIAAANGIVNYNLLYPGQVLRIP